ncbi:MAG: YggT family protein [Candidatus Aminicenantes bacterium]|nr:YggT family protein [Candidatus Aminicenantes bacterium]
MMLVKNILLGIIRVTEVLLNIEIALIIIRAIFSWFPALPFHSILRVIWVLTEPVLRPIRRFIPPWKTGGLDLSPLVAVLLIWAIEVVILDPIKLSLIYGGGI